MLLREEEEEEENLLREEEENWLDKILEKWNKLKLLVWSSL